MIPPQQPPPGRRPTLPARLLGAGARAGERVASATGIDDALEVATEEAIVRALESPAVERAILRVLESEAAQESLERTLSSPAVERAAAKALDSEVVNQAWDRLLASEEVQKLVERIADAPEVRSAIAAQGAGLIGDLGRQIRRIADRFDGGLERFVRRLIGKPRTAPRDSVGLVSRGIAFLIDLAILDGIFLATAAVLSALFGSDGVSTAAFVFGATAWVIFGGLYLFTFWSLAGQTPGMRFLSIQIEHEGSRRLGPRVARRRLVGAVLAAIPFGLGYLGVVTRDDQRGFHDRHADTDVVRVDPVAAPWSQPVAE
ncbi:MAG TPA: RDD family protein [Solirubrobacterales bacterium]|jgi:uncharacterized RDD family membrane protein YckC